MQKSRINDYIIAQREGKSPEEIAFVVISEKNNPALPHSCYF
jgi:hypothetical protein